MTGKLTLMHHYTIKIIIFACIGKKKEINGFENPKISYSIHNLIFTSTSNLMWEYFSETPRQKSFRTVNTCGHKSFLTQTGYIVI